jgi:pimeloyl-ACP methyl ester carboxylesterase
VKRRGVPQVMVGDLGFHVVRLGPGSGREAAGAGAAPSEDGAEPDVHRAPVVFLHGLVIDNISTFYYTLAPVAARRHPVVCYDMRGHGASDRPPTGYRMEDGVDDLFGILDTLGITEPVHLVGYSFGGTLAMAAAAWRPERVAGLVLIETEPNSEDWSEEMVTNLEDVVAGFDDPEFRRFMTEEAPRGLRRLVADCEELVTRSSLPADFRSSKETTLDDLARLTVPALLIFGDNSEILDVAFLLDDTIPDTELCIIKDCSHQVMVEAPEIVERHLASWLDRQSLQAAGAGTGGAA